MDFEMKSEARARYRELRDSLGASGRAVADAAIVERVARLPEFIEADAVFTYLSVGAEVDTRSLIRASWDVGKLVAVRPIGRRNRSVLWECRCDCGNMKEVVGHHLTTGKVRSCGCLMGERSTPPGRAIDLTGQQFGDLIVIERSGTRNRYALWTCRCSCGATREATSNELRSGRVTNCGGPQHDVDVIVPGRRFGKLTAVSKTDEVRDGSPVWRCLCDCDRPRKCTERELLEGRALSCGKCDA